jgi:hypothetical protein
MADTIKHRDYLGTPIEKGDDIIFMDSKVNRFMTGTIIGLGVSRVSIGYKNRKGIWDKTTRFPNTVVKMENIKTDTAN